MYCVKSVQIPSNFWSVFSYIQSEYRKIRTRNNSVFGHFTQWWTNLNPFMLNVPILYPLFFSEKRMKQWNVSFAPINSFVPNITFLYTLKTINENYSNWLNFLLLLLLKLKKLRFFAFLRLKKTSLRLHNYYGHSFLQEKKPYFITQCNPILANFCPMLLIYTT